MNCIKCGVKIAADQVFCPECLEDMQKHPVKPDTPLFLPAQRPISTGKRTSRKKTIKPEERISSLRKTVVTLIIMNMILLILLTFSVMMLLNITGTKEIPFLPGQNYGTSPSTVSQMVE